MEQYDERYDIRLAKYDEIPQIMAFIEDNWKKGHILARDRNFFEYEFLEEDGTVNVLIAIDRKKRTIEAMQGILKASKDKNHLDIWGSCWKVLPGNLPMLGFEVWNQCTIQTGARYQLGIGGNPDTAKKVLERMLHVNFVRMKHYYMLNDLKKNFQIAKIVNKEKTCKISVPRFWVERIYNEEQFLSCYPDIDNPEAVPYKDAWYLTKKYFHHPIYRYEVFRISHQGKTQSFFVIRLQEYGTSKVARIVEYIGDSAAIAYVGNFFKNYLEERHCEYIDFYNYGMREQSLLSVGFIERTEEDANIIPNYFHPFVQENIDIWIMQPIDGAIYCKADGDQDRPG